MSEKKILELENSLLKEKVLLLENQIRKLMEILQQYQNGADESFSPMRQQLEEKIECLEKTVETKNNLYKNLQKRDTAKAEKIEQLELENSSLKKNGVQKIKNERGAGRKSRFTQEQFTRMREMRLQGVSLANIASEYKCSVGLVHKIVNEENIM